MPQKNPHPTNIKPMSAHRLQVHYVDGFPGVGDVGVPGANFDPYISGKNQRFGTFELWGKRIKNQPYITGRNNC